jgi:hypothetical protein
MGDRVDFQLWRPISNRIALRLLYAVHQDAWAALHNPTISAIGYLRNHKPEQWDGYLGRDIRGMAIQQARRDTCNFCDRKPSKNSIGDHVVPRSKGGIEGMPNYLAMCRPCNSSKGDRDLIEWRFMFKGQSLLSIPLDVLCIYARLHYQHYCARGELDSPAPEGVVLALEDHLRRRGANVQRAFLNSTGIGRLL